MRDFPRIYCSQSSIFRGAKRLGSVAAMNRPSPRLRRRESARRECSMMRHSYRVSQKLIASAAAALMAATMVVAVPGTALATYDSGSITAAASTVNAYVGAQVDMSGYFTESATGGDGQWHVDYKVTDGSAATINKHSGVLTPTAEGSVTVTAYLTGISTPQGNKNNPCKETTVSASTVVNVSASSTYGYQGSKLGIKMSSPTVSSFSGSNADGWTNVLSGATATDDVYCFTVAMNNGFKNYSTADKFAKRNAGNISVVTGSTTAVLNSDNSGNIFIKAVDVDSKTIVVGVKSAAVTAGATQLVFASGFRGNNDNNTLGTSVSFIVE